MYSKLLKYEWRATRGMLGVLSLVCLGASLAGGGVIRLLIWSDSHPVSELLTIANVLALMACVITIVLCAAGGMLLYVWRFYKSRFTGEGFVTFTLPVTTHQNLLSAMLNTAIGTVLLWLAVAASFVLMVLLGLSGLEGFFPALGEVLSQLPQLLHEAFSQEEMKYYWLLLLNIPLGLVEGLVVMMLSVTLGSVIAGKHKILASLGCYYGIQVVLSILSSIASFACVLVFGGNPEAFLAVFGSTTVILLVTTVGGYFLTYFLADRKLNLT